MDLKGFGRAKDQYAKIANIISSGDHFSLANDFSELRQFGLMDISIIADIINSEKRFIPGSKKYIESSFAHKISGIKDCPEFGQPITSLDQLKD